MSIPQILGLKDNLSCPLINILSLSPFFPSPCAQTAFLCLSSSHFVNIVLFVSLQDLSVNLNFPLSHSVDFFLFLFLSQAWQLVSAKHSMFFISLEMSPTKTHVPEKDHSKQLISLTTPDGEGIECNKEQLQGRKNLIKVWSRMLKLRTKTCQINWIH